MQLIEGSSDSVIFEQFMFHTLGTMRKDPQFRAKNIVVLLDNSTTHKASLLQKLADQLQVNFLFSAPYSPFLQPAESLFSVLKRHVSSQLERPSK
jgi:transposase